MRNIWGQIFPKNRRMGETETRRNDCFADEKIAAVFTSFYPPYSSLPNPEHLLQIQLIYQYLGP